MAPHLIFSPLSSKETSAISLLKWEALAKVPFPVILRERSDRRIPFFQELEILRFAQDDRRTNFATGSWD